LRNQRVPGIDVVLVDNESTDDTVAIAEAHGVTIRRIAREDFSYGRALNIGIDTARHDVVALLSSHCVPIDELWAPGADARYQRHRPPRSVDDVSR
jgi:glycosyltransferase involved in cell wall biosynthesis